MANAVPVCPEPAPVPGTHLPTSIGHHRPIRGAKGGTSTSLRNEPFLEELRARGSISRGRQANYLKTALSLDSSRNMRYLDFAGLREKYKAPTTLGPLYDDLSPFRWSTTSALRVSVTLAPTGAKSSTPPRHHYVSTRDIEVPRRPRGAPPSCARSRGWVRGDVRLAADGGTRPLRADSYRPRA